MLNFRQERRLSILRFWTREPGDSGCGLAVVFLCRAQWRRRLLLFSLDLWKFSIFYTSPQAPLGAGVGSFEEWKKEEEIRTKSFFVKRGGAKKVTNKQFTYYMCHRSGIAIIKSERKHHEKIGGSIKCGKTCPAFMTSIREQQEAIKITVEYQSVHAGHEMEVGKLNLHEDDRRNLAALLKAGVPSTKIIEDIQNKCLPTERLGLLIKRIFIIVSLQTNKETYAIFVSTAARVASTEEMKRLNQCLEDLMKHMGYSEFGSSLRSIENFPANRYNIKQRQKKNSKPLNKQKLTNVMTFPPSTTMQTFIDILCFARNTAKRNFIQVALVEGWMVLLETAVVAVDGLGTCLFCDVDVTFRGRPLFRSGATGEVFMSLTGVKAEVW
ncbi:c2H2-type domain-containing protein [Trichonephila clavipes]|nr:c2H2-type domain-containing protein [Trichonephila clavipes]